MSRYTDEEISRIISECEILILPETESTEVAPILQDIKKTPNTTDLETEDYFEQCFEESKRKKQNLEVSDHECVTQ